MAHGKKVMGKVLSAQNADLSKKLKSAYHQFITGLKSNLLDCGRTPKSVKPNCHIMISIAISSSGDTVPDHVDSQIKKSVLDALSRVHLSHSQALQKIAVRKY